MRPAETRRRPERDFFRDAVLLSILLHLALWAGFYVKQHWVFSNDNTLEIDLTKPFTIGGNPLLKPGGGTLKKAPKNPGRPALVHPNQEQFKPAPPKDWVLPGPQTKVLEKPAPEAGQNPDKIPGGVEGGTGQGFQGSGNGWGGGDGEGGGIPLTRVPELLNRSEILKLLRKNYPPAEREAGQEGAVVVDLHLDAQGRVTGVEVVGSGGADFDRVAQKVAQRMRFSPAMVQAGPVAVKIRQSIDFQLEE